MAETRDLTYKQNYIEALRNELVQVVENDLTPIALQYRYTETPLEENIKWRPIVLVLGNYSSGKSTLINELLERPVQVTGQAPTDDSFTVITYQDNERASDDEVETRDGKVLLNDPVYPFAGLKRHGQRFASHFRLKKIRSPFLKNLALIDTPGMLDSVSERDRGYNYQEVIADLARIADLILVLFDPHKAGTIRETYESLRLTLPKATYEDRVLFVLNRVDECSNLNDLLRVYGTLCWNLSQMTGRKDIPQIHLTYSPHAEIGRSGQEFLGYLKNQRDDLRRAILEAPKHRLDHLATYIEEHSDTLTHFLEGLINYGSARRRFVGRHIAIGSVLGVLAFAICYAWLPNTVWAGDWSAAAVLSVATGVALAMLIGWLALTRGVLLASFHRAKLRNLDSLTPLDWQSRRDSWERVKPLVESYLARTGGRFKVGKVRHDYKRIQKSSEKSSREARAALGEVQSIHHRLGEA